MRVHGHARVYVPTHFGHHGYASHEVVAKCRCGWQERIIHGRQKDAAEAYRTHLRVDVLKLARD